MAVEWTITIEGKNEFGDVCRKAVRINKSWAEDEANQVVATSSPVAPLNKQFATAPSTRLKDSDIEAMAM